MLYVAKEVVRLGTDAAVSEVNAVQAVVTELEALAIMSWAMKEFMDRATSEGVGLGMYSVLCENLCLKSNI